MHACDSAPGYVDRVTRSAGAEARGGSGPVDRGTYGAAAGPDPAPQPRGRGVAARGDAALARRDHAPRSRPGSRPPTSTSRRTATSSTRSWRSTARASRSTRSPSPRSCGGPTSSTRSAAGPRCCRSRPPRRVGQRRPLRQDRHRARAAAAAHRGRGRHPGDGVRRADDVDRDARPGRVARLRGRRAPRRRLDDRLIATRSQQTLDQLEALYGRDTDVIGRPDRLHRSRRAPPRAAAVEPRRSSRRGPAWARPRSRSARPRTSRSIARQPVLFFSMEMGTLELTKRLLAAEAQRRRAQAADRQPPRRRVDASATRSAGSARRRSSSTTTRTARSWRCGPRRGASRPATATSG